MIGGNADHLAGYTGLPTDLNPYRSAYGSTVPVAGAVLPAPGVYDIVFDTHTAAQAGPFTFRWWINDVTPPRVRLASALTLRPFRLLLNRATGSAFGFGIRKTSSVVGSPASCTCVP